MTWLDVFLAYGHAVDVVMSAVHVWGPVLLGAASLGVNVRRIPRRGRHRRTRPDASGHDADTPPDIGALMPALQP
ncbi:hypothetical protein ACFWXA_13050 [Streptomyces atroolivaceus]|uniref:hypothetical protein n=1 Tax=Streptomyces atroolivaceus TaxID=66869 RepID=UPI003661F764